jgi:acetyltransferase-like isoleucine patch superfamily enzyme
MSRDDDIPKVPTGRGGPLSAILGWIRRPLVRLFPAWFRRTYRALQWRVQMLHPEQWASTDVIVTGRHSYGRPLIRWYWPDDKSLRVRIGSFVSMADEVTVIVGGQRPTDRVSTYPFRILFDQPGQYEDGFPRDRGDVVIGNDVWIGRGALILSGVQVGDGAVIGAGSVVASDVRPYAVVVGNPAQETHRRFNDEQVQALLRIRWWDWPDEKIAEVVPLLNDPGQVDQFIERYDSAPTPAADARS